eukprot:12276589-Karenia_brevis.AAC.1
MHQCHFGAATSKPTRWMGNLPSFKRLLHVGWPKFDEKRKYVGPLPQSCGHSFHEPLIGAGDAGKFKTSAAAAYPTALCEEIAQSFFTTGISRTSQLTGGAKMLGSREDNNGPSN